MINPQLLILLDHMDKNKGVIQEQKEEPKLNRKQRRKLDALNRKEIKHNERS